MDERIPRYPKKRSQSWKQNYRNLSYWYDLISGTFNIHQVFSQLFTTCVVPKSCTEHCNFLVCNVQCKPKSKFDETCKIHQTPNSFLSPHLYLFLSSSIFSLMHCCWVISNILKTLHNATAILWLMWYMLILQKEFKPVRYFSIDRVFRNETLDNTHLAEFHQIEGVVADVGLTLGDLMGVIKEFFQKLGIYLLTTSPQPLSMCH